MFDTAMTPDQLEKSKEKNAARDRLYREVKKEKLRNLMRNMELGMRVSPLN